MVQKCAKMQFNACHTQNNALELDYRNQPYIRTGGRKHEDDFRLDLRTRIACV